MTNTQSGKLVGLADIEDTLADIEEGVTEIENHLHPPLGNLTYGLSGGLAAHQAMTPMIVTGGNNAFGTGVIFFKGTAPGVFFDLTTIYTVVVSKIDSPTILEFWSGVMGTGVAYTSATNDIVTASGHGLIDGDRVIFDTMDDESKGINKSTVYHVRDMSGTTFKVALTAGGAAVDITGTPTGNIKKISSPERKTEVITSSVTLTKNADQKSFPCPRINSTHLVWCRAKSVTGDTTAVSFFFDAHSYTV